MTGLLRPPRPCGRQTQADPPLGFKGSSKKKYIPVYMASILIRDISLQERQQAHLAVRALHNLSLQSYLKKCLRELRARAREQYPDLFNGLNLQELSPIDRVVYRHLTEEGRRSAEELHAELGLPRTRLRESLSRLCAVGLVDAVQQGRARRGRRGAPRLLYVSLGEK